MNTAIALAWMVVAINTFVITCMAITAIKPISWAWLEWIAQIGAALQNVFALAAIIALIIAQF